MKNSQDRKLQTKTLVLGAILTAFVIVLQLLGTMTTFFGPFSTAVALIPIVIGAAMCGTGVSTWLGLIFGIVVLVSGGANLFLMFNIPGTIITVILKGMACGFTAGIVYKLIVKLNKYVAIVASAIICPITNTAVFLLGCYVFFMKSADLIASNLGLNVSGMALFWTLAMGNFLFELVTNIILTPVIIRVLNFAKK